VLPTPVQCTGPPSVSSALRETSVFCLRALGGLRAVGCAGPPLQRMEAVCVALVHCSLNCTAFPPRGISARLQGVIPCTPPSSHWFLYLSAGFISSTSIKMKYFAPLGSKLRKRGWWPPHCEEELMGGHTPLRLLLVS